MQEAGVCVKDLLRELLIKSRMAKENRDREKLAKCFLHVCLIVLCICSLLFD